MDMTSAEFTLMYAFYSLPNIILPLIGGMYSLSTNVIRKEWVLKDIQSFVLHLYIFTSSSKCITTGYLIDRVFGIRLGATIFAALIAGGKIVALNEKFWKETIWKNIKFWVKCNVIQNRPNSNNFGSIFG